MTLPIALIMFSLFFLAMVMLLGVMLIKNIRG